jgi:CBS domain-containing protein
VFKSASLDVVKPTTTFADLIEQLATNRLQRVYVVGADGSAQSIITLTDVLRVVSGCSIPKVGNCCRTDRILLSAASCQC